MIVARVKAWGACVAVLLAATLARAQEPPASAGFDALASWVHTPEAQRNRVDARALSEEVEGELLSVLARGVSRCDCAARRLRWAWALPLPHDRAHPAVVVAFVDPPRNQESVLLYMRVAFLRFREGRYVVTSALALRRPAVAMDADLTVRLLPRRDVDADGQLDIALRFQERWQTQGYCGRATFASASEQLSLVEETCASEESLPDDGASLP